MRIDAALLAATAFNSGVLCLRASAIARSSRRHTLLLPLPVPKLPDGIVVARARSARLPEQDGDLITVVAEEVALGLVDNMRAEVLAHDAVP